MIKGRISQLLKRLAELDIDAIFITNQANVRYMSSFSGDESYLLLSPGQQILITDSRYSEQAEQECPDYQIVLHRGKAAPLPQVVAGLCQTNDIKRLAFEQEYLSYALFDQLTQALADNTGLIPASGLIEQLRYIKSADETEALRRACAKTDLAFQQICGKIKPGISEKELAAELLYIIGKLGCESSFPIIIASGVNGSLPHAIPSDKLLAENEFITMDFGCMYDGYHADMTRTVMLGKPDSKQRDIYNIVLTAKQKAEELIRHGAACKSVDAAARDYIASFGYKENFAHGLGHGVGLDIHEAPSLNASSEQFLQKGNFVTVEPGIYLPGWGGVRIEDTVLVEEDGYENMFTSPLDLLCL